MKLNLKLTVYSFFLPKNKDICTKFEEKKKKIIVFTFLDKSDLIKFLHLEMKYIYQYFPHWKIYKKKKNCILKKIGFDFS